MGLQQPTLQAGAQNNSPIGTNLAIDGADTSMSSFAGMDDMSSESKQASKQDWLRAVSPTNLRYLSALRGYAPTAVTEDFHYAMLACGDGELLLALAASNPDGNFFGFDGNAELLETAIARAEAYGVTNVRFAQADVFAFAKAIADGTLQKPQFDYVVANLAAATELENDEIATTVALANSMLTDGGLCYVAYPVTKNPAASLEEAALKYAQGANNTDQAQDSAAHVGLSYLGSAKIRNNYLEFSVPGESQEKLLAAHGQPVYETLKDYAMATANGVASGAASGANVRHDVWVKPGLQQTSNDAARLGSFSFVVATPTGYVDPQFRYFDKKLDLTTPLFTRLLTFLSQMPHTIGDLLAHPDMGGASQDDVLVGVQMLVAAGIVEPTRGNFSAVVSGSFDAPRFNTSYNERLRSLTVSEHGALLASPTLGRPVIGTAPMVMALQALDAGGLQGAEEILDQSLQAASSAVKALIPTNLDDAEARRNTAFHLLEQACKEWLLFCCVQGILNPA